MRFWIKNTSGQPDAMLTFSAIAFAVVIAKMLFSGEALTIKGHDVNFGTADAAAIAALLTPTLGAYVARRHSDVKYGPGPDGALGTDDDVPIPEPTHEAKEV